MTKRLITCRKCDYIMATTREHLQCPQCHAVNHAQNNVDMRTTEYRNSQ